jgi:hypothetical protein
MSVITSKSDVATPSARVGFSGNVDAVGDSLKLEGGLGLTGQSARLWMDASGSRGYKSPRPNRNRVPGKRVCVTVTVRNHGEYWWGNS